MKKIFFAIMATAALASCSQDEVMEISQQKITFGDAFVDNIARIADPTYGTVDLTTFYVYGTVTGTAGTVNIFDGVKVTGNVGETYWSYNEEYNQYWIPKASYSFAAVVDANTVAQNDLKMPTSLTYETAGQKDLLYATATATVNAEGTPIQNPVNFTFSHLLSKVQFTVTSNAAGGYYHSVTGIKVSNFQTGTYTIADGTWDGTTAKDIEFGAVNEVTQSSGAKTNATQMLLVPNAAAFNVTFTVDLYKNGTKLGTETKTISVTNELVKGNAYNFIINCSVGNKIEFTVTNNPTWSTPSDVTVQ